MTDIDMDENIFWNIKEGIYQLDNKLFKSPLLNTENYSFYLLAWLNLKHSGQ